MDLTKEMTEAILACAEGVYLIEEDTHTIVYANPCLQAHRGRPLVEEKCYAALMGRAGPCPFCPPLREGEEPYAWDYFDATGGGWLKVKNLLFTAGGVHYRAGNLNVVADMMGLSREAVTEMGELNRVIEKYHHTKIELEYESTHDRMTRLYNRNQYIRDLSGGEYLHSAGVLFFDLNNLKEVNDRYRHAAGDMLLLRLAAALGPADAPDRRAYRIGGDEFVVLCKDGTHRDMDNYLAEIYTALAECNAGEELKCSVAVGTAWSDDVSVLEKLVSIADRRMYEDKERQKRESGE